MKNHSLETVDKKEFEKQMGKQIQLAMNQKDERKCMEEELKGHYQYYIWNRAFAWIRN